MVASELHRSNLERTLDLDQIANSDIFVGQPSELHASATSRTHLFGGRIAAQSVVAAGRTVPSTHRIHSLHSYFILAGDGRLSILFRVTRIRDGSSFKTRQVLALQNNKPIFMMIASFHAKEPGAEFQRTPEEMSLLFRTLSPESSGPPFALRSAQEMLDAGQKIDYGGTPNTACLHAFQGLNHTMAWRKHTSSVWDDEERPWVMHAALLTYMSDEGLLTTARQPYERETPISMTTSLDHMIYFHRPFRADEWLLFHNETTVSSGARGVARTEVFTDRGVLVASFVQEGLVRPSRSWKPERDPEIALAEQGMRTVEVLRNGLEERAKL